MNWGRVMHICVDDLGQPWFRYWRVAWSSPSHYLNQCWRICQLDIQKQISVKFEAIWLLFFFHWRKYVWICRLEKWIPSCLGLNELNWASISGWSTLTQVMSCCLTAPSHSQDQCWPIDLRILACFPEQILFDRKQYTDRIIFIWNYFSSWHKYISQGPVS